MEEIWKDIKGYEGKYQVSNLGRVKSLNYRGNTNKEVIMANTQNKNGYFKIGLSKNNKKKNYTIHKLVAEAFIPNPNNLKEINHKDEDKSNNKVDNLEWCNHKENCNYGTRISRCSEKQKGKHLGKNNPNSKKVRCITTGEIFSTMKEAADKYNMKYLGISNCCTGRYKYSGIHPITGEKLRWEYVD